MSHSLSEDEYDALPDPFAGVDWEALESLNNTNTVDHSQPAAPLALEIEPVVQEYDSSDEYDNLPDPFAGIVWNGDTPVNTVSAESRRISPTVQTQSRGHKRTLQAEGSSSISSKKSKHQPSQPLVGTLQPPSQQKPSTNDKSDIQSILKDFEDDIVCPICCDIFACVHLGNPCGHSYCGQCGWNWMSQNNVIRSNPTCPICRASLSKKTPMIPNFAMDNLIERHVSLLAEHGVKEWAADSENRGNWEQRKRNWKETAPDRAPKPKEPQKRGAESYTIQAAPLPPFIYDEDPDDEDYVDEDGDTEDDDAPIELVLPHTPENNATRRRRRRRRRGNT